MRSASRIARWSPPECLSERGLEPSTASPPERSSKSVPMRIVIAEAAYAELGISVTFDPVTRMISAESRPVGACRTERVGQSVSEGRTGLEPVTPCASCRKDVFRGVH
jgi:hypothetical protein